MSIPIQATLDYAEANLSDVGVTILDLAGNVLVARTAAPVVANTGGTRYRAALNVPDATTAFIEDWDAEAGAFRTQIPKSISPLSRTEATHLMLLFDAEKRETDTAIEYWIGGVLKYREPKSVVSNHVIIGALEAV